MDQSVWFVLCEKAPVTRLLELLVNHLNTHINKSERSRNTIVTVILHEWNIFILLSLDTV